MSNSDERTQALPRRFYKTASAIEGQDGWAVALDGRVLNTPAKVTLSLPSEALARAVAAEWDAQGERIDPSTMPLTHLAYIAIDRTPDTREELAAELAKYTETDLVCHLADAPSELRARQEAAWRPLRDWAGKSLDIVLIPVEGIIAARQPTTSLEAARAHALSLDDFRLTGLAWACSLFGSAVLALAVERGETPAEDAFEISRIDEAWQIEQWGEDAEAQAAVEARRRDAHALGKLFSALPR
ncbi:ATP12 family chaperone protein [Henriciella aquimarina]|uniref:ATP12 family chaperone protein n=1 Tax=Henriciella aquimarina TaxID=545261 RepID=UPI000A079345|nr:ATP12 family protein [Henriciella aquimarina]